ncbi:glycosyltransferase [Geomonas sp. RF6]|uniref:glycosyltransferase n=1 Tax=Geomonas sp. RF6 TaxID=2897342 RepID=UPI001E448506|nr:glycosyltransferase [Geomonas sp. RF6]UFS71288.1 glycosyltransferase [Geomonas sp. RF6]
MAALHRYQQTRGIRGVWRIEGYDRGGFDGCVVIPALAESERLFATLHSLALNPAPLLERFLVVVVVNHREDAAAEQKEDNRHTLQRLRDGFPPLNLALVDAAGDGLELPAKTGGVGLARKIGMDLALSRLTENAIIACLDADTTVEQSYLPAILTHFADHSAAGGAVLPFRHQKGESLREERAITLYELFLRHYVLGLTFAGSPYAFHTVGSAMACTVPSYIKMGGMNSRSAAEDFYFLQHLQKTAGVSRLRGSTVHPAARSSHRVPFGTGKSVSQIVHHGEGWQTFYSVDCFLILKEWLHLVQEQTGLSGRELLCCSRRISRHLTAHLEELHFEEVWERLSRNAHDTNSLLRAFHCWFDGLKTVRLVHRLCHRFPRQAAAQAVPDLLAVAGFPAVGDEEAQLDLLRDLQNGTD